MEYDELELDTLGEEKTALFVIISDTDATFNFVVSIMFITKFPNVVIGLFAVVIFVVFDVVSSTKNDVIMNVSFVNMGGNNIRIFSL